MAVIQYKPNKDFETVLDVFSSKGKFGLKKTGIEGATGDQGKYDPAGTLTNAVINSDWLCNQRYDRQVQGCHSQPQ
jgi:iron complex outermembrane recepter protein